MPAIDWDAIQRDWELDKWTNRELSRRYGVSHTAIGKKAAGSPDAQGNPTKPVWVKRVAGKVDQRTREILATDGAEGEDLRTVIEQAAQAKAEVTRTQRRECEQLRKDLDLMGATLRKRLQFAAELPRVSDDLLASITLDGDRYMKQREKLHEMERKAYALDPALDGDASNVGDEEDDELLTALESVLSRRHSSSSEAADAEAAGEAP